MFLSDVEVLFVEGLGSLDIVKNNVTNVEDNHQDNSNQVAEETIRGDGEGSGISISFSEDSGLIHSMNEVFVLFNKAQDALVFVGGVSELQDHQVVSG